MRAVVLRELGEPAVLQLGEAPDPRPEPGEALSVNFVNKQRLRRLQIAQPVRREVIVGAAEHRCFGARHRARFRYQVGQQETLHNAVIPEPTDAVHPGRPFDGSLA